MSCDEISFKYLEYPPPVMLVSLSFLKTLKCSGKISPFLTQGISLSSKNEFGKLSLLQSGQAQEHEECINCLYALSSTFGIGHNGLLCGY